LYFVLFFGKLELGIIYTRVVINVYLYHYFDSTVGPFVNLSDIPVDEAKAVLNAIRIAKPKVQSANCHPEYMEDRHYYEEILKTEFAKKGGIFARESPHYMVVEHSPWLYTWFENCDFLIIPVEEFDLKPFLFTYGDSHPTFSPRVNKMDGKEYRRKLYTYDGILPIIEKYGLPQEWNNDGIHGPERYIEAHIWSDETINRYR
jgi:hypothetical protein